MPSLMDKLRGVSESPNSSSSSGSSGSSGFAVPWAKKKVDKANPTKRERMQGKLKSFQERMMQKVTDQAAKAITGGVSGLLILLTVYKVISSRESVLADSRKEIQRHEQERKQRIAYLRRSLASPLRAAARDLSNRIREILRPCPGAEVGEPPIEKDDYFAGHYLTDPEMSIDSTLYRLCRYLFWVNQLETNVHSGESSLDDVWQIAVDVRLERVRQALASTDELVLAVRSRERLYEVIDAEVQRHKTAAEMEAEAAAEKVAAVAQTNEVEAKPAKLQEGDANGGDDADASGRSRDGSPPPPPRASLGDTYFPTTATAKMLADSVKPTARISEEPTIRISRYPLRLFEDTQIAVAEVFGDNVHHHGAPLRSNLRRNDSVGSNMATDGEAKGSTSRKEPVSDAVAPWTTALSYTDFVMKLEMALSKPESTNDPWVRWLVPLHRQYHRYASLQARFQRQLTGSESRELLAARVRLRRIDEALMSLLEVLRRRLDDPWFGDNMKIIRRARVVADSNAYTDVVGGSEVK